MFDRFTKFAAAAVLATGVASSASAQLGDYSGPYVGLLIGYGAVDLENEQANTKNSITGFDFAGFVGYEVRDGSLYYSGEFEIVESLKEDDVTGSSLEKQTSYALNARVGTFLTDGTLVYALAGVEMADFETSAAGQGGEEVLGLRIGAGAEFRALEDISVRSEVIYTTYEDSNIAGTDTDISDFTVRVGGVYRFQF